MSWKHTEHSIQLILTQRLIQQHRSRLWSKGTGIYFRVTQPHYSKIALSIARCTCIENIISQALCSDSFLCHSHILCHCQATFFSSSSSSSRLPFLEVLTVLIIYTKSRIHSHFSYTRQTKLLHTQTLSYNKIKYYIIKETCKVKKAFQCNVFKIRSTVSLVPTSGLQTDLKELGPFSGNPTQILGL